MYSQNKIVVHCFCFRLLFQTRSWIIMLRYANRIASDFSVICHICLKNIQLNVFLVQQKLSVSSARFCLTSISQSVFGAAGWGDYFTLYKVIETSIKNLLRLHFFLPNVYAFALIGRCGVQQELVPPIHTHRTGVIYLYHGLAIFVLLCSSGTLQLLGGKRHGLVTKRTSTPRTSIGILLLVKQSWHDESSAETQVKPCYSCLSHYCPPATC